MGIHAILSEGLAKTAQVIASSDQWIGGPDCWVRSLDLVFSTEFKVRNGSPLGFGSTVFSSLGVLVLLRGSKMASWYPGN